MKSASTTSGPGVFVALLRAVNVGGNNMISMRELKGSFETLGFTGVTTYINSGNIVFKSKETDARKLEAKIERMMVKDYNLDSKVVIRTLAEMEKLVAALPRSWDTDTTRRYYVIFLRHTIDSEDVLAELPPNPEVEEIVYHPGTLLWSALISELTRSKIQKLSTRKIYKEMTIRNVNTTRKLLTIMTKTANS